MNRKVLLAGLVLVVPLIAFLALGLGDDPTSVDSPLLGKAAPPFALSDLSGETWDLESLRGTPVVINFWATWCQPCLWEHPVLVDGARRYRGKVQFLGVILHDEASNVQRYIAQEGAWGPALIDPDSQAAIAYGVYGAPETFFIDGDGIIVYKHTGPVTPEKLDDIVGRVL